MSRPAIALIALVVLALGLAALTTRSHHPDELPGEKAAQEEKKQADAKDKEIQQKRETEKTVATSPDRTKAYDAFKQGAVRVKMEVEERGTMTLELYPQAAPKTVAHFTDLVKKGFYDGILFHRVIENFMAQTGDPESKKYKPSDLRGMTSEAVGDKYHLGMAGSGQTVPLENQTAASRLFRRAGPFRRTEQRGQPVFHQHGRQCTARPGLLRVRHGDSGAGCRRKNSDWRPHQTYQHGPVSGLNAKTRRKNCCNDLPARSPRLRCA